MHAANVVPCGMSGSAAPSAGCDARPQRAYGYDNLRVLYGINSPQRPKIQEGVKR
jgi:hypothetical protein